MFMKSALVWAMKRINSGSEVGHVFFYFLEVFLYKCWNFHCLKHLYIPHHIPVSPI